MNDYHSSLIIDIYALIWTFSLAQQTIYLDRFGVGGPVFNPKTITAPIGERIDFLVRLGTLPKISPFHSENPTLRSTRQSINRLCNHTVEKVEVPRR